MNEEAHPPPHKPEITDDTLRRNPLIVPWTYGDYYAARYLAGCLHCKLSDLATRAVRRGLHELARETLADHIRNGKFVNQRLVLMASPQPTQPLKPPHADPPP